MLNIIMLDGYVQKLDELKLQARRISYQKLTSNIETLEMLL